MNIEKKRNGTELLLAVEGRLDTITAPQMEAVLDESMEGVTKLVLDLAKLQYISSAGLRVLLYAQQTMDEQGNEMKVINVSERIMDIFSMTGFLVVLTIE